MNGRLQGLINRGYSEEDVIRLATFTPEELDSCSDAALKIESIGCTPYMEKPIAIYIGGQPGSGKTTISMGIKNNYQNIIEIGIDNFRTYHPRYLEMEEIIKKHWEGREEKSNDTPGNDIADFTHLFSGAMTDEVIKKATDMKYNVVIEWGMREPTGPLDNMTELKAKGYDINVTFVSVDKYTSMEACDLRSNVMNSHDRIIRRVPPAFHELCVETLPASIDYLYTIGKERKIIDNFSLIDREGINVWNENDSRKPGSVYSGILNNKNKNYSNNGEYAEIAFEKEGEGLMYSNTYNKNISM